MKQDRQQMYRIVGVECNWCHKGRANIVNLFHPEQPVPQNHSITKPPCPPRDYYQIALCAGCLRRALKIAEAPDERD